MSAVHRGKHHLLEAEADRLIKESLKNVTRHSEKSDILTEWKETDRRRKEVYVRSGTPDPSVRKGNFYRSLSPNRPHLNSREGITASRLDTRTRRESGGTLAAFVDGLFDEGE